MVQRYNMISQVRAKAMEMSFGLVLTDLSWVLITVAVFNLDLSFFSALWKRRWNIDLDQKIYTTALTLYILHYNAHYISTVYNEFDR